MQLVNRETGKLEEVPDSIVPEFIESGKYVAPVDGQVNVDIGPDGRPGVADVSALGEHARAVPQEVGTERYLDQEYGDSPGEAFLGSAASAFTLGLSDVAARALGASPERLREARARSPIASGAGELAGVIGQAVVAPQSLLVTGGEAAIAGTGAMRAAGALGRIGAKTAGGAVAGGIYGVGRGISETALAEDGDLDLLGERVVANIRKGALWGGIVGGGLGVIGETVVPAVRAAGESFVENQARKMTKRLPEDSEVRKMLEGTPAQAGDVAGQRGLINDNFGEPGLIDVLTHRGRAGQSIMGLAREPETLGRQMAENSKMLYDEASDVVTGMKTAHENLLAKAKADAEKLTQWPRKTADAYLDEIERLSKASRSVDTAPTFGPGVSRLPTSTKPQWAADLEAARSALESRLKKFKVTPANSPSTSTWNRDTFETFVTTGKATERQELAKAMDDLVDAHNTVPNQTPFKLSMPSQLDIAGLKATAEADLAKTKAAADAAGKDAKLAAKFLKHYREQYGRKTLGQLPEAGSFVPAETRIKKMLTDTGRHGQLGQLVKDNNDLLQLLKNDPDATFAGQLSFEQVNRLNDVHDAARLVLARRIKKAASGKGAGVSATEAALFGGIAGHAADMSMNALGVGALALAAGKKAISLAQRAKEAWNDPFFWINKMYSMGKAGGATIARERSAIDAVFAHGADAAKRIPRAVALTSERQRDGEPLETAAGAFKRRADRVDEVAADPARSQMVMERLLADDLQVMPGAASAVIGTVIRAATYLAAQLPRDPYAGTPVEMFGGYQWEPSRSDMLTWNAKYAAVKDPVSIIEDLASGTLIKDSVDAVRAVYPKLYERIKTGILKQMQSSTAPIPYQQRVQLGLLFDTVTDPSMLPENIAMCQTQLEEDKKPPVSRHAPTGKLGKMYSTSEDAPWSTP